METHDCVICHKPIELPDGVATYIAEQAKLLKTAEVWHGECYYAHQTKLERWKQEKQNDENQ